MENYFLKSDTVSVRYIVNDLATSVVFYTELLGFEVVMKVPGGFAMLSHGNLRLMLNEPGAGGAGQLMPDGTAPAPGGWNRIMLQVKNIDTAVADLKRKKAKFRNEMVIGNGGKQILLLDPSNNVIEILEPKR